MSNARGVTSPLAIALLFSMVIVGIFVVVSVGAVALEDTKAQMSTERAEKTMTQFDSRSAMVALGGTKSQSVALENDQAEYRVREDAGWMNVTIKNTTSGDRTTLVNQSLGAVVYENKRDNTEIAYQGGGVWKQTDGGSTMVSPPEFHYRNATLTLPIISVTGNVDGANGIEVTKNGSTVTRYPNKTADENFTNPLDNGKVNITVHSKYYRAWGSYFEQRTEGEVTYHDSRNEVSIILKSPIGNVKVQNGMAALTSQGKFTISGAGGKPCGWGSYKVYVDSYDSSAGSYCSQTSPVTGGATNGNVTYGGEIDLKGAGNSDIRGTLKSDKILFDNDNPNVFGELLYVSQCQNCDTNTNLPDDVGASKSQISNIPQQSQINSVVTSKVDEVESDNDNGPASAITGKTLKSGDRTLDDGTYFLKRIDLSGGEKLTLDTTGGDVIIVVDEYVDVHDGTIDVDGSNTAKIYINGSDTVNVQTSGSAWGHIDAALNIGKGGTTEVPNDNSSQLWFYGKDDLQVRIKGSGTGNQAHMEGVIYAPIGSSGPGRVYLKHAQVFGGIVTGDTYLDKKTSIHYDESLKNRRAIKPSAKVIKLTYLHVTVNRVNVTSA